MSSSNLVVNEQGQVVLNLDSETAAGLQTYSPVTVVNNLNGQELNDTQLGAGLQEDGSYLPPSDTNYLDASTSLLNASVLLDSAIKSESDRAIDFESKIVTATGISSDGTYQPPTGQHVISTATSMYDADMLIDAETSRLNNWLNQNTLGFISFTGSGADAVYYAPTTSFALSGATSLYDADVKLDNALSALEARIATLENDHAGDSIVADPPDLPTAEAAPGTAEIVETVEAVPESGHHPGTLPPTDGHTHPTDLSAEQHDSQPAHSH